MRSLIAFPCEGERLIGTLDAAPGTTGVLIVSGGNEIRIGAHRGMAMLAQALAAQGTPVLRYDRRGIGDSSGANHGWESAAPDLAAAIVVFRAEQPQLTRIVGFGNCDAATTLALFGREAGLDAAILANPWLGHDDAPPPPVATRARYLARLRDVRSWRRGFNPVKLISGLRSIARSTPEPALAARIAAGLADIQATLVLAQGDRTAQLFEQSWGRSTFATVRDRIPSVTIDTASHSFARAGDALAAAIQAALTR
jgi:exosortase A-associated hydrolase 1